MAPASLFGRTRSEKPIVPEPAKPATSAAGLSPVPARSRSADRSPRALGRSSSQSRRRTWLSAAALVPLRLKVRSASALPAPIFIARWWIPNSSPVPPPAIARSKCASCPETFGHRSNLATRIVRCMGGTLMSAGANLRSDQSAPGFGCCGGPSAKAMISAIGIDTAVKREVCSGQQRRGACIEVPAAPLRRKLDRARANAFQRQGRKSDLMQERGRVLGIQVQRESEVAGFLRIGIGFSGDLRLAGRTGETEAVEAERIARNFCVGAEVERGRRKVGGAGHEKVQCRTGCKAPQQAEQRVEPFRVELNGDLAASPAPFSVRRQIGAVDAAHSTSFELGVGPCSIERRGNST